MDTRARPVARTRPPDAATPNKLLREVRQLIIEARAHVARTVNAGLTLLYWQVGDRIRREVLKAQRAQRGERIVALLARQLEREFGRGFAEKNLRRMIQFGEIFPDQRLVVSLIRQLTWTHFIALIPIKDALVREFCAEPADTGQVELDLRRAAAGMWESVDTSS